MHPEQDLFFRRFDRLVCKIADRQAGDLTVKQKRRLLKALGNARKVVMKNYRMRRGEFVFNHARYWRDKN